MFVKILASDTNGKVIESTVSASRLQETVLRLQGDGYAIVELKKSLSFRFGEIAKNKIQVTSKINWVSFSSQLSILMEAGLTIDEALSSMSPANSGRTRTAIDAIGQAVKGGQSLSEAIQQQESASNLVLAGLVKVAEKNGFVVDSLRRFVKYEEEVAAFRSKLVGMSIYPTLVAIVGLLVVLFLLTFVLPRFATAFNQPGRELVGVLSYLLPLGKWLSTNGALIFLASLVLLTLLWIASKRNLLNWQWVFNLPLLNLAGRWRDRFTLARFFQSMALLIESGHTLTSALAASTTYFKNETRSKLQYIRNEVEQGHRMTNSLESQFQCNAISLALLRAGERSGNLPSQLKSVANFEIAELTNEIERYLKIAEPILLLCIGTIVAAVLSLLYLPLFDLAGAIK
jgi:general secretion pathway protein F